MNVPSPFTPSKLLLFGEYTVIFGSKALAVPLTDLGGYWDHTANTTLQFQLPVFAEYIEKLAIRGELQIPVDWMSFKMELADGLYFHSNIPIGYGLGSSGALVAALIQRFGDPPPEPVNFSSLQKGLAQLESFFHGSSSGLDPLVCYIAKPVLVTDKEKVKPVEIFDWTPESLGIFLINTGKPRSTGPLVRQFLKDCENPGYEEAVRQILIPANEKAIGAWIEGNSEILWEALAQISDFQFTFFEKMILPEHKKIWSDCLHTDDLKLKLCGAGGGGFILGFAKKSHVVNKILRSFDVKFLDIPGKNDSIPIPS